MKNKTTKKITLESISESINDLAMATAKGFDSVDNRFDELETRLTSKINSVEKTLSAQIVGLDNKVDDLAFHKVRDEVHALTRRMTKMETKIGMKS
jgi:uncharacterized coiled-coil protein SlyX